MGVAVLVYAYVSCMNMCEIIKNIKIGGCVELSAIIHYQLNYTFVVFFTHCYRLEPHMLQPIHVHDIVVQHPQFANSTTVLHDHWKR